MMWRLFHWLFGWDYIGWKNSYAQGIARVYIDGTGQPYYFRYKTTQLIDRITAPDQVVWLTCTPDKYTGEQKENTDGS